MDLSLISISNNENNVISQNIFNTKYPCSNSCLLRHTFKSKLGSRILWYGIETPARGILLSIYLAILIFSAVLLFKFDPKMVMALLSVQIIYKLLSPIMAGTITNPVIISNLFIALFHSYSVWKIILS